MIQLAVLAVVALVLGLFVLRPILTSARAPRPCRRCPDRRGGGYGRGRRVLTGEIDDLGLCPGDERRYFDDADKRPAMTAMKPTLWPACAA